MAIGDRIKAVRGSLSRDKFALQTCISKSSLVNYETGERNPPSDYLLKILEQYSDINPAWLLTGEGPMRKGFVFEFNYDTPGTMDAKFKLIRGNTSLSDFVGVLGVTNEYIEAIEKGEAKPDWNLLSSVCHNYGVNPSWLIEDEGPMLKKDATSKIAIAIDKDLIKEALQAVEEYLQEMNGTLPPDKKAELVMLLCDYHLKEAPGNRTINKATVISLVRLAV